MMSHPLIAVLLLALGQTPTAQSTMPALAEPYVDGSEEFAISPPVGWQLNRQRLPDARGVTVLRMIGPFTGGPSEEIAVRRIEIPERRTPDKMLKELADALGLEFSDVRIASQQVQQIGEKQGGFLCAAYGHEGMVWRRMQAFVEVNPRSYLLLVYNGPLTTDNQRETLFQMVASSLRFLTRRIQDAELRAALEAGQAWMAGLADDRLKKAVSHPFFLRLEMAGKASGFISIESSEYVLDKRPGIRILERGWTFESGGQARSIDNSMFLSWDRQNERWISNHFTLIESSGQAANRLECSLEEGLRIVDRLSSGQSYSCGMPASQNTALKLPKSYLSRALVRLLPRLVDNLATPRRMAFTTFDHLRGDLVIRIVEFKGECPAPEGAAAKGKVFRIDEQEGLASEPSSIYVDAQGRTVFVKAGRLTMRPAERDALEREMGTRVAESDRKMSEIGSRYAEDQGRFDRTPVVLPPPEKAKP
ncbi:MAG: hypothetical protein HZA51_02515 [Planctomycetes bacterium]|nr:hypothetical protein [Planctomycetota bacterium]